VNIFTQTTFTAKKQSISVKKKLIEKPMTEKPKEIKPVITTTRGKKKKATPVTGEGIPVISANNWAIYDVNSKSFVGGVKEHEVKQMASLTKMMTALVVVSLCDELKIDYKTELVKVTRKASNIGGSTAKLSAGDILTVE